MRQQFHGPSVLTFICLGLQICTFSPGARSQLLQPTAIIGAFTEEVRVLEETLGKRRETVILGTRFVEGTLSGRKVVIAETGIGKVNAAVTTALLLDHYNPTEIIFTGVAGGLNPDLFPGDVVIGAKLAQHDMGTIDSTGFHPRGVRRRETGERNPIYLPSDSTLLACATLAASRVNFTALPTNDGMRIPRAVVGTIVTGDVFVASDEKKQALREMFHADAVEMEGGAVAQICYQQGTPFVVLRSLSDSADRKAWNDAQKFVSTAAHNSAALVLELLEVLSTRKN